MPTTLGIRYNVSWTGYPAHMSPEDTEIWKRYKDKIADEVLLLYFDVGLGGQTEVPPDTSPEMAMMWLRNTQKRTDVVAETLDGWIIIELRENATASAIGRLLLYQELWKQDPPDNRPVTLRLVTNREDVDVKALSRIQGIAYIVV